MGDLKVSSSFVVTSFKKERDFEDRCLCGQWPGFTVVNIWRSQSLSCSLVRRFIRHRFFLHLSFFILLVLLLSLSLWMRCFVTSSFAINPNPSIFKVLNETNYLKSIRIRLRRRSMRRQQAARKGQQRCHRWRHWWLLRNHRSCSRSRPSVSYLFFTIAPFIIPCNFWKMLWQDGLRSRWITSAELPWWAWSSALPLGGRLHHERLATHWPRFQVVPVQYRPIRSFPQV